jgi:hypothetical protein
MSNDQEVLMPIPAALTPLLDLVDNPADSAVGYVIGGLGLNAADREGAAQLVADIAMSVVCGVSPVLDRWRRRRDGGPAETGTALDTVRTYISIGFGSSEDPPNVDHLQGHVAEIIWNLLLSERSSTLDGRQLVRVHAVKADPLEPGGDGLVIYSDPEDVLVFRLWEIKKHDAQGRVSATINRASKQLARRGHEYLAKLAAPETVVGGGALGALYGSMVDLWFDRSDRAGVGVAVGTSDHHAPGGPRAFRSIRTAFPGFEQTAQTESVVVALPDFPGFANRVKEIVWSGL